MAGRMVVAAIDFGTTYSGCAYSFRSEWEKDPLRIFSNNFLSKPETTEQRTKQDGVAAQAGVAGTKERQTEKVPTTILFDPEQKFVAFGYEAEDRYMQMAKTDEEEAKRWYYFSKFKMKLHTSTMLTRDTMLMDFTQKKKLPALKVFSEAIRFLRNHVLAADSTIHQEDVEWVLTVPAIWTDKARQFMREAARLAGIPDERLSLALEPEAASVLCLEEDRRQGHLGICQPGSRFMVVDNGGGTADITVYEVVGKEGTDSGISSPSEEQGAEPSEAATGGAGGGMGILKELHHPTGGPCAGVKVDQAFKNLLVKITSFDAIQSMDKLETLDLERDFEEIKRTYADNDDIFIKLPPSGLLKMQEAIRENQKAKAEQLFIVRNRLKVPKESFENLFTSTIEDIIKYMKGVKEGMEGELDTILLVGGFSDCLLLQSKVKEVFPECKVLIPPDPAAAVLKGAVLFRHDPTVIGWRASAFTYGVEVDEPFKEGRHREEKAVMTEKGKRSLELFATFIKRNEIVKVNSVARKETFLACDDDQTELELPIFKSKAEDPIHTTDDGCEKMGDVKVQLQDVKNVKDTKVDVEMVVGGTELIVRATNATTGEKYTTVCDFLCQ